MTVPYIAYVHTADNFGTFFRLLTLWRGSIIKGVGRPLLIYCLFYSFISILYRTVLSRYEYIKNNFEMICVFTFKYQNYLPLDFILGFYVTQVIGRWWLQFEKVWWPDALAMDLAAYLPGPGYPRLVRRELVRLANLSSVMALVRISSGTAKRFPTMQHFVTAGLMTDNELLLAENMDKVVESRHHITWLPICWAQARLQRARQECPALSSDFLYQTLHKDLQDVADRNGSLICYNWVSIPLMYTQLVTMAVHIYFASTLLGSQYLRPTQYVLENGVYIEVPWGTVDALNLVAYDNTLEDFYIPIFTLLRFVFYFAWLHVAEVLINPFGEDDEDFDVNYLIDRNVQVSYLMVDAVEGGDELEDDPYSGNIPMALPHTVQSIKTIDPHPPGNMTDHIIENLNKEDMQVVDEDDIPGIYINTSSETLETIVTGSEEPGTLPGTPTVQPRVRYVSVSTNLINTPENHSSNGQH